MDDLSAYCSPGTAIKEEMIAVSGNVSLRVITFKPPLPGHNPAIVFIAGWVSLIEGWQSVLQEMTRDFTVIYLETREKISSRVAGKVGYGVEDIGRDIAAAIKRFDLEEGRYILFGSSLGATAILDCCRNLERMPLGLVLVCPNAVFRVPAIWRVIIRMLPPSLFSFFKPLAKWYLRTFRLDVKNDYAQYEKYCNTLDAADPWKLKKGVIAVWHYQVWDLLAAIELPTLIVSASKDKLHEPGNLKKMAGMIKNAVYIDLETNSRTHSEMIVQEMRKYIPHFYRHSSRLEKRSR